MIIGYARTSTDQQAGLAAQERDLTAAGAKRVFAEQVSSVTLRAALEECLSFLPASACLSDCARRDVPRPCSGRSGLSALG